MRADLLFWQREVYEFVQKSVMGTTGKGAAPVGEESKGLRAKAVGSPPTLPPLKVQEEVIEREVKETKGPQRKKEIIPQLPSVRKVCDAPPSKHVPQLRCRSDRLPLWVPQQRGALWRDGLRTSRRRDPLAQGNTKDAILPAPSHVPHHSGVAYKGQSPTRMHARMKREAGCGQVLWYNSTPPAASLTSASKACLDGGR